MNNVLINVLINVGEMPIVTAPLSTTSEQTEQVDYDAMRAVVEKLKGALIKYRYHDQDEEAQNQVDKERYSVATLLNRVDQLKTICEKNTLLSQQLDRIESLVWLTRGLGEGTPYPTLEELPLNMALYLTNLRLIDATFSNLTEFPLELLSLPVIEQIDFSDSRIETIVGSQNVRPSKSLYRLHLSGNPITKTEEGIAQLQTLKNKVQCLTY